MRQIKIEDLKKDGDFYRFRDSNLLYSNLLYSGEVKISEPLDIIFGTLKCEKLNIPNRRTRVIAHKIIAKEINLSGFLCARTIDCPKFLNRSRVGKGQIRTNTELSISDKFIVCNRPPINKLCADCGNRCTEHGVCFIKYAPEIGPVLLEGKNGFVNVELDTPMMSNRVPIHAQEHNNLKIIRVIKA